MIDQNTIVDELSEREINWIYKQMGFNSTHFDSTEQIVPLIKNYTLQSEGHREYVVNLKLHSKSRLVPDEELEWIERNDYRLLRWMINFSSSPSPFACVHIPTLIKGLIHNSRLYTHFLNALDNWEIDLQEKRSTLEQIKSIWSDLLRKDSKLTWLQQDNDYQMKWAWDYLKTNTVVPTHLAPVNTEERYSNIQSIFDCWPLSPSELQLFQNKMSRAWAQQKYRANLKDRKQTTFVLSINTKEQLQKMAKTQNVNLNQMLEHIINQAFKNSKKGKSEEQ